MSLLDASDTSDTSGAGGESSPDDGASPDDFAAQGAPEGSAGSDAGRDAAGDDGEEAVRRHFSGRRDSRRFPRALLVVCRGIHRAISGVTIDISRGGMLVELSLPWNAPPEDVDLLTLSLRVRSEFPDGMFVRFDDTSVSVRAKVVRIAIDGKTALSPKVGCRFTLPLSRVQCAALGVPLDDTSPEGASRLGSDP